ncbi:glycoside hydrolase family 16 protein [Arthrobacter sp. B3I9]|uniref:glycoside hydrolase family 16 protein n=1 Tax=Arthrobacter sp. B3I9 TaxID=3042270 RepID=UPI0027D77307|nr:glycoside hydrolase family 16 protein [Arthrobacter sp. B3I9]
MGALSLTGCSIAPASDGAADQAGRSESASSATLADSSAAASMFGAVATDTESEGDAAEGAPAAAAPAAPAPAAPAVPAAAVPAAATPVVPAVAVAAAPAAATPVVAAATAGSGTEAATNFNWGPVLAGDEFSNTGAPDSTKWSVFKGPGHHNQGVRSPQAWSVANGVATVSGDSAGTTGGMSAKFAQQKYGRWESRMRTSDRDPKYHPVMILWPNNNASSNCAEIDYAEGSTETAMMKFFLHYKCGGGDFQTLAAKPVDSTQWHNYAVEWTPAGITGYIDGVKTFSDTNPAHQPTVGMHQTLQLDWFPDGSATKASQMQVDWVRVYK